MITMTMRLLVVLEEDDIVHGNALAFAVTSSHKQCVSMVHYDGRRLTRHTGTIFNNRKGKTNMIQ